MIDDPTPYEVHHRWYRRKDCVLHKASLTMEVYTSHAPTFPEELYQGQEKAVAEAMCEAIKERRELVNMKWIHSGYDYFTCSDCGFEIEIPQEYRPTYKYCPRCGAVAEEPAAEDSIEAGDE